NALGTIYEVFFIWRDAFKRGSRFDVAEFDVMGREAVTFGGNFDRDAATFWRGTHPRGLRWAFLDWDFPGLQTAVSLDGTLNDNRDLDKGWFVEMALPWAGMNWLANGRSLPPQNGDEWRMFFGRFQKLLAGGTELEPHPAWCWTPHGVYDTHRPESFTCVQFSTAYVDE
ncbi:MAG: carbohydrate-binding family 9-like protein, partial [Anaerolineales bacterium]|nr:carbohydrate-binding family 9-like protein [Anaerolineales bacterium]